MGNSQKKKEAAKAHNMSFDIQQDMFPIGVCSCGGNLFMFLRSSEENLYNVYCDSEDCGVSDIRDPVDGDKFFWAPQKIVDELAKHYGADLIDKTFKQPPSSLVNNAKPDRAFEEQVNLKQDEDTEQHPTT